MTRDDVIRWAGEVGFQEGWLNLWGDNFERFAKLVAAAEREACARICDGQHEEDRPSDYAYAIRARKDSA